MLNPTKRFSSQPMNFTIQLDFKNFPAKLEKSNQNIKFQSNFGWNCEIQTKICLEFSKTSNRDMCTSAVRKLNIAITLVAKFCELEIEFTADAIMMLLMRSFLFFLKRLQNTLFLEDNCLAFWTTTPTLQICNYFENDSFK